MASLRSTHTCHRSMQVEAIIVVFYVPECETLGKDFFGLFDHPHLHVDLTIIGVKKVLKTIVAMLEKMLRDVLEVTESLLKVTILAIPMAKVKRYDQGVSFETKDPGNFKSFEKGLKFPGSLVSNETP